MERWIAWMFVRVLWLSFIATGLTIIYVLSTVLDMYSIEAGLPLSMALYLLLFVHITFDVFVCLPSEH